MNIHICRSCWKQIFCKKCNSNIHGKKKKNTKQQKQQQKKTTLVLHLHQSHPNVKRLLNKKTMHLFICSVNDFSLQYL